MSAAGALTNTVRDPDWISGDVGDAGLSSTEFTPSIAALHHFYGSCAYRARSVKHAPVGQDLPPAL